MVTKSTGYPLRAVRPCPGTVAVVLLVASVTMAVGAGPRAEQVEQADVKQVMATCLWKFVRYVKWPDGSFADDAAPVVIGILGEDPFGATIDLAVKDRKVGNRRIELRRFRSLTRGTDPPPLEKITPELHRCHVLFIAESERESIDAIIDACADRPVLTVSDLRGFARERGMIEFVLIRDQLKFHVNRPAYERARLHINARLLNLARKVYARLD